MQIAQELCNCATDRQTEGLPPPPRMTVILPVVVCALHKINKFRPPPLW